MLNTLKKIFGCTEIDFADLKRNGALIVDVRSPQEYQFGHIKNSINIPVSSIKNSLSKLTDKKQPIITCCASGMRSASAKSILKNLGYENVVNGGSWISLEEILKK